jgi:trimeric autotransporter adhesin
VALTVGAKLEDSAATGIGGDQTDDSADGVGAAYVFTRSGTAWNQQAYLVGSDQLNNSAEGPAGSTCSWDRLVSER